MLVHFSSIIIINLFIAFSVKSNKWLSKSEGWLNFTGEVALYWRTLCSIKTEYSIPDQDGLDTICTRF